MHCSLHECLRKSTNNDLWIIVDEGNISWSNDNYVFIFYFITCPISNWKNIIENTLLKNIKKLEQACVNRASTYCILILGNWWFFYQNYLEGKIQTNNWYIFPYHVVLNRLLSTNLRCKHVIIIHLGQSQTI